MKLKSETKQTIEFLSNRNASLLDGKTLLQGCELLNLNYDMVQRGLILLHRKQLIDRDSRGKGTSYSYPAKLGLGDIVEAIEGIDLAYLGYVQDVIDGLNKTTL
jgi:hypothetical protein